MLAIMALDSAMKQSFLAMMEVSSHTRVGFENTDAQAYYTEDAHNVS